LDDSGALALVSTRYSRKRRTRWWFSAELDSDKKCVNARDTPCNFLASYDLTSCTISSNFARLLGPGSRHSRPSVRNFSTASNTLASSALMTSPSKFPSNRMLSRNFCPESGAVELNAATARPTNNGDRDGGRRTPAEKTRSMGPGFCRKYRFNFPDCFFRFDV